MRFDGEPLQSVQDVLEAADGLHDDVATSLGVARGEVPIWFRGASKTRYRPVPSIGRPPYSLEHERSLLNAFMQNALLLAEIRPASEWDWLFLMRHHDVPTRLLDWTESPLIALYFAVANPARDDEDGALWVLYPTLLNQAAGISLTFPGDLPIFDDKDENLGRYLPSNIMEGDSQEPLAGIAIRQSRRMVAQHSVFTINHREQKALDEIGDGRHIGRFIIPNYDKAKLRRQLEALVITHHTVFPDLDSVGKISRRRFDG